jgi:hypothetical protein
VRRWNWIKRDSQGSRVAWGRNSNPLTKMAVFWVVAPCSHQGDDGGSKDIWNAGKFLPDYTTLQPRTQPSSYSPPWEPQILLSNPLVLETQLSTSGRSMQKKYSKVSETVSIIRNWNQSLTMPLIVWIAPLHTDTVRTQDFTQLRGILQLQNSVRIILLWEYFQEKQIILIWIFIVLLINVHGCTLHLCISRKWKVPF